MNEKNPLDDFQHELRAEMVAAARTRAAAGRSRPESASIAIRVAAVAVSVAVVLVGLIVARPDAASADVFEITRRDDVVILKVVDLVEDPASIVEQLSAQLSLQAQVLPVPVPDHLVGMIITVGSLGSLEPSIEESADRTVATIRLPTEGDGPLIFEYGRPAQPGEDYKATAPDRTCADFAGLTVEQARAELLASAETVRFEFANADGSTATGLTIDEVAPGAVITEMSFLNSNSLLVDVTLGTIDTDQHPNCTTQPS